MARTVLLTGGAGYIGSHTYVALVEAGYRVVILDDFSNSKPSVIDRLARLTGQNRVRCVRASILDRGALDALFQTDHIQAVVHFAARKAVGESVADPLSYVETNVGGLTTLLQAMQAAGVRRLVFSSSATVYGEPDVHPTPETAELKFTNPYGFTKLTCEHILRQVEPTHPDWAIGILRYFNPVGAHPSGLIGEDPQGVPDNLMPYIARVATGELPKLRVFGDDYDTPDGTGIRDYIHVCDLAEAHVRSLDTLFETGTGHCVNVGTGQGYSVLDMLAAYERACGKKLPYEIVARRPGDVPIYLADPTLAKSVIGFEATRDLDAMCRDSWNWITTGAPEA